jgi:hypothetical protein
MNTKIWKTDISNSQKAYKNINDIIWNFNISSLLSPETNGDEHVIAVQLKIDDKYFIVHLYHNGNHCYLDITYEFGSENQLDLIIKKLESFWEYIKS